MMRKLAVTVFALSLAALGCGSDSGTKPVDTGVSSEVGKTPDAYVAPGVDTGAADAPMGPEVALDAGKIDATVADAPAVDQAQGIDTAPQAIDAPKGIDVQAIDSPKTPLDGGVDAPQADAVKAVDGGSVDAGNGG
jgi:hypothetical protein